MKRLLLAVCAVSFILPFCLVMPANAQNKKNNFSVAFETGKYIYREPRMDYPISIDGDKIGVELSWLGRSVLSDDAELVENDRSFASFQFRYVQGKVDYDGFISDGTKATGSNIDDYYLEGRFLAGAVYEVGHNGFEIWPYMGFGVRYLVNKSNQMSSGYRRTSKYFYLPIGLNLRQDLSEGWYATLNGEVAWLLYGRQDSYLHDTDPNFANFSNDQNEGYGLRTSFKIEKSFGVFGLFVEPYYRFWHIQNSDTTISRYRQENYGVTFIEPFNITREYGFKVGVSF